MNTSFLHDPTITSIDLDGNLRIDLLALAIKAEAPYTPETFDKLKRLVHDAIAFIDPNHALEYHFENTTPPSRSRRGLKGAPSNVETKSLARNHRPKKNQQL